MANYMDYYMAMKIANIAELKNRISQYLSAVEKGEEIEVRRRNAPIARIVPTKKHGANATKLGCGKGTGTVNGDPTEPLIPGEDWAMLREEPR